MKLFGRKQVSPTDEMTFVDHLEDLRGGIAWCVIVLVAAVILAFAVSPRIMWLLEKPLQRALDGKAAGAHSVLRELKPGEGFLASIRLAFAVGIIIASPVIVVQIWKFLAPGLQKREQQAILWSFLSGIVLFAVGTAFGYFVLVTLSLRFLWLYSERMGISPMWTVGNYISFVGTLLIASGLIFEAPVVICLLNWLGVLNPKAIARKRMYILLGIFLLAAVLTPPDVMTQVLLALPLWALLEVSIVVSRILLIRRRERIEETEFEGTR